MAIAFGVLQITIKEEDRLAAVISEIDSDVRIVPRRAYVKTPTGQGYVNRSFEGTRLVFVSVVINVKTNPTILVH